MTGTRRPTDVEHAFALARSGNYRDIDDLHRRMKADGYAVTGIEGPALMKQLKVLLREARRVPVK